jgi:hypothetical protein
MTILTSVTEFEDRFVEAIREIQRPVLDYVRKGVERAEGRIPRVNYPANLPKPNEIVDSQVEFAKALFDAQRDFARELVDAVAPLVEPEESAVADRPATTAKATTNPKTATKKKA